MLVLSRSSSSSAVTIVGESILPGLLGQVFVGSQQLIDALKGVYSDLMELSIGCQGRN